MNITEYFTEQDSSPAIYQGKMTLRANYTIVDADESCYRYIGGYSALPLPAIAHPDDAEDVRESLDKVSGGTQRMIFRMMAGDHSYHFVYVQADLSDRMVDGAHAIELKIMDIVRISYKFDADHSRVAKYRKLMTLSDKMYFEYKYDEQSVNIFEYINDRSYVRFHDTLDHLRETVMNSSEFSAGQKAEFETLQENLTKCAESMDVDMDGRLFGFDSGYLNLRGGLIFGDNAKQMMVAIVTVTGKLELEEKYYMSRHAYDNATSVYNKRAISELAADLMADGKKKNIFLCIVDIDDFKNINDTYGHLVGDEVIAKVAEIIKSTLAARGYVGRFGGDEFLIVTDKIATSEELIVVLKTIRKHIGWTFAEQLVNTPVTTSIGIACYPKDADTYEELFKIADKCLYLAKAKGKNRFIMYIEEIHKDIQMDSASDRISKSSGLNIYTKSCQAVVDVLGGVGDNSREALDDSVRGLMESCDIDRVGIFAGEGYKRVYYAGNHAEFIESLELLDLPQVAAVFDETGTYAKNKILSVKDSQPVLYEQLDKQGTEGFIVVKVQIPDRPKTAVVFDVYKRARKWSNNEKGLLYIAAQVIVRRYFGLEG